MGAPLHILRSQLKSIAPPTKSFEGQTIIVTGSNGGLGLEAARHFAKLGAAKVILAVRNIAKGEAAASSIHESIGRNDVCEVWHVDMGNFDSVKKFTQRAAGLSRLDIVLENAGISAETFVLMDGFESNIAVNVVGTFLMALGLLPTLRKSAKKTGLTPRLVITTSDGHAFSTLEERHAASIFDELNQDNKKYMANRYMTSKLLEILIVRALASRLSSSEPIILNCVNPGMCRSELMRDAVGIKRCAVAILMPLLARTTEVGGGILVCSAEAGPESRGCYMSDCVVEEPAAWVRSSEGRETQERVYEELMVILERLQPGISKNV